MLISNDLLIAQGFYDKKLKPLKCTKCECNKFTMNEIKTSLTTQTFAVCDHCKTVCGVHFTNTGWQIIKFNN